MCWARCAHSGFVPTAAINGSSRSEFAVGSSTPIALALLRLITSLNFVARSVGFCRRRDPHHAPDRRCKSAGVIAILRARAYSAGGDMTSMSRTTGVQRTLILALPTLGRIV
jgi:hypothetical protein